MKEWYNPNEDIPEEGTRVLCVFKGEPIVLEMGYETPTHEDNFRPYYYWFEPYDDVFVIEWDDVTLWQPIEPWGKDGE